MPEVKRILIVSEAHLIRNFVQPTLEKIKAETGTIFDCFITTSVRLEDFPAFEPLFENIYINNYPKGILNGLPKIRALHSIYGLRKLASTLGEYDIVHIHFHYYYYAFLVPILRKKTKKLFVTFFGSDFYRINQWGHRLTKRSLSYVDGVFAISENMLENLINKYRLNEQPVKTGILIFLMRNFISFGNFLEANNSLSAKKSWGFSTPVIVCGYSAASIMQHELIIEGLKNAKDKTKGYKIIFPMTYGWRASEKRLNVRRSLAKASIEALIIEDFLPIERLHELRLATDIFINIPSSDQMAASMLEHLAAGSVVITGTWLPYQHVIEKGIYMVMIDSPEKLGSALGNVIDNLDFHLLKSAGNRSIILEMMKWESIRNNWFCNYEIEVAHERV